MQKSEYQQSIERLLQTFNIFQHKALDYIRKYPESTELREQLALWLHPRGITNLIKTLTLNYQIDLPYPEVKQQQYQLEKTQPMDTHALGQENPSKNIATNRPSNQLSSMELDAPVKKEADPCSKDMDVEESSSREVPSFESSFNNSDGRSYKRGPYKSYSMNEKLQAVELLLKEELSITEISRHLGIPCKNIKRWATEGVFRKRGGGRRRTNPGMEEDIFKWINRNHSFGDTIQIEEIQDYALSRTSDPNFKASRGWAIKFIDRFNLRNRYGII